MSKLKRKGDIAVAKAIATFTELGCTLSIPLSEALPYDLVVDAGGKLYKVQVKFSTSKNVDLRRQYCTTKNIITHKYAVGDYDWLYIYSPALGEYFYTNTILKASVTLSDDYRINMETWQNDYADDCKPS